MNFLIRFALIFSLANCSLAYGQFVPFAFFKQPQNNACQSGGVKVSDYCWYAGASNEHCDTVCGNVGLIYDPATRSFAGSDGTNSNCQEVLDALGLGSGSVSTTSNNRGCQFRSSNNTRYRGTQATTSSGRSSGYLRACACMVADRTPDAIDWANFDDNSSVQTITGINTSINVRISVVLNQGAPDVWYRKDGGSWTLFSSSVDVNNVSEGSTLEFRVIGNVGDAATFTITNLSDSNTVLDTVTGTVTIPADVTPDAVNWADFSDVSTTQTLTGFNRMLSIELSASAVVGNPTVSYSTNGGSSWNSLATPVILNSVGEGFQLRFKVEGTLSHSATITIKNLTDSNAIIDTTVGTVACSGVMANNSCYYMSNSGQSCDAKCSSLGRTCNLAGTQFTANMNNRIGAYTACEYVFMALGYSRGGNQGVQQRAWACGYASSTAYFSFDLSVVTCAASQAGYQRICACD